MRFKASITLWMLAAAMACAQGPLIHVYVDGVPLILDTPPVRVGERVMVPLRGVFESLGTAVYYNPSTHVVLARRQNETVLLGVGASMAHINGRAVMLDSPPLIVHNRVLIPLRFLAEAMGTGVTYDPRGPRVAIDTGRPVAVATGIVMVAPTPLPRVEDARLIRGLNFEPRITTQGSSVTVQGRAAPGGHATYDVGRVTGVPMVEVAPGLYQGTHSVSAGDGPDRRPVMHESMEDGREGSARSPVSIPLTVQEVPPPPLLFRIEINGTSLHPGQRLVVGAQGTPGQAASFSLGRFVFPMTEMAAGWYRGEYVVQPDDNVTNGRVLVTLTAPGGLRATLEAPDAVNLVSP